jgi:hypothetical protein
LSVELAKFDTYKLVNPEVSGIEYQQGTLAGYDVREYLLEKFNHRCVYCGVMDKPLEVEHLRPRIRGGSDRIDNLAIACEDCNRKKGNQTAEEFGFPELYEKARQTFKDVAVVNATRWAMFRQLSRLDLPLETGTGSRTKHNRYKQEYPKAHWIDAACIGESGWNVQLDSSLQVLLIKAVGHGKRQRCGTDPYGFPIRHAPRAKKFLGFQTGDMVEANVPKGKYAGRHIGRIAIRYRPSFKLNGFDVHPKYLRMVYRADGYEYDFGKKHCADSPPRFSGESPRHFFCGKR